MSILTSVLFSTSIVLTSISSDFDLYGFDPITRESEFRSSVVGQTLSDDSGNWFLIHPDGTISGKIGQTAVMGAWRWHDSLWCRNLMVGTAETGTECHQLYIKGNKIRSSNRFGNEKPYELTIGRG